MLHSVIAAHPDDDVCIHYLHGPEFPRPARAAAERLGPATWAASIQFILIRDNLLDGATHPRLHPQGHVVPHLPADCCRARPRDSTSTPTRSPSTHLRALLEHDAWATTAWARSPTSSSTTTPAALPSSGCRAATSTSTRRAADEPRRDARASAPRPCALIAVDARNADLICGRDQDALNVVLGERRLAAPPALELHEQRPQSSTYAAEVFGDASRLEQRDGATGDPPLRGSRRSTSPGTTCASATLARALLPAPPRRRRGRASSRSGGRAAQHAAPGASALDARCARCSRSG